MTLVKLIYLVHQLSILHFLGNLETCWFVLSKQSHVSEDMAHRTNMHQQHFLVGIIQHPRISESQTTFRFPRGIRNQKNAVPPAWHKRESERSRRVSKSELTCLSLNSLRAGGQKWSSTLSQEWIVLPPSSPAIVYILHNPVREKILIRCESWN